MRKALTHLQVIQLSDRLKAICSRDVDGFATYAEGYDDARVAKEMPEVSPQSVSNLRRTMFGDLPKRRKAPTLPELIARIEALEAWAAARGPGKGEAFKRTER